MNKRISLRESSLDLEMDERIDGLDRLVDQMD